MFLVLLHNLSLGGSVSEVNGEHFWLGWVDEDGFFLPDFSQFWFSLRSPFAPRQLVYKDTQREVRRVIMTEIQFKFDFRRKKKREHICSYVQHMVAKTDHEGFRCGWIQHSNSVIRNQSLSISQLHFHPLTDLSNLVRKSDQQQLQASVLSVQQLQWKKNASFHIVPASLRVYLHWSILGHVPIPESMRHIIH